MAAADGPRAGQGGLIGFVDRVGFQRWAGALLIVYLLGVVAVLAPVGAAIAALLTIGRVSIGPPVLAGLVVSIRRRLAFPADATTAITGIGLIGAAIELASAAMALAGGGGSSLLVELALGLQGVWFVALGVGSRRGRTLGRQAPQLALIAGVGLLLVAVSLAIGSDRTMNPIAAFASVLVLAEYVLLLQLARAERTVAVDRP